MGAPLAVGFAMADIFISYHALALKLSAFLEAEGWSVWWDKSLAAADLYRDEIMKQLATARAVISIWTPNSIKSDWVRAEAGRAKADGKLIPVKTSDVAYADIPLPFGEMHTENIESSELIRAAVVAQLAKPAVEPTAWVSLTKGFKYELLTWVGIVGGALTLFGHMSDLLKLADWARVLVESWKAWTQAFWVWAFGWLGIDLPPEWTPVLTFLLFGSLLTIGQAIQFRRTIKTQPVVDKYQGKSFQLISWRMFFCVGFTLIAYNLWVVFGARPFAVFRETNMPAGMYGKGSSLIILTLPYPIIILAGTVLFARYRLHAAVVAFLLGLFWVIISLNQIVSIGMSSVRAGGLFVLLAASRTAVAMLLTLTLIMLSVVPAKAISRRLIFLALGLILLIALNELSKLGLDVTAPKLQG